MILNKSRARHSDTIQSGKHISEGTSYIAKQKNADFNLTLCHTQ